MNPHDINGILQCVKEISEKIGEIERGDEPCQFTKELELKNKKRKSI